MSTHYAKYRDSYIKAYRRKRKGVLQRMLKEKHQRETNPVEDRAYKDQRNQHRRERYARLKLEVQRILGGKCSHCGIADNRVLQIDHIHGGGNKEVREKFHNNHICFFTFIIENKGPRDRYQLLCANCHVIKTFGDLGVKEADPHKTLKFNKMEPDLDRRRFPKTLEEDAAYEKALLDG